MADSNFPLSATRSIIMTYDNTRRSTVLIKPGSTQNDGCCLSRAASAMGRKCVQFIQKHPHGSRLISALITAGAYALLIGFGLVSEVWIAALAVGLIATLSIILMERAADASWKTAIVRGIIVGVIAGGAVFGGAFAIEYLFSELSAYLLESILAAGSFGLLYVFDKLELNSLQHKLAAKYAGAGYRQTISRTDTITSNAGAHVENQRVENQIADVAKNKHISLLQAARGQWQQANASEYGELK